MHYSAKVYEAHHPLVGQNRPTITDLLGRCNEPAASVLRMACALSQYRCNLQGQIIKLMDSLQEEPWAENRMITYEMPPVLISTDLLRALMATHHEELRSRIFSEKLFAEWGQVSQEFGASARQWANIGSKLDGSYAIENIEKTSARRFALLFLENPNQAIDIPLLIGALDDDAILSLSEWSKYFKESLPSQSEFIVKAKMSLNISNTPLLPKILPAYFDRHDGLASLEIALAEFPGAVVLGQPSTGRSSLINALIAKRIRERNGLLNYCPITWYFMDCTSTYLSYLNKLSAMITNKMPTCLVIKINCMNAFNSDVFDLPRKNKGESIVDIIKHAYDLSIEQPESLNFILATSYQEYNVLAQALPDLRKLPIVRVPDWNYFDIIPIALCQLPFLEDTLRRKVLLLDILALIELFESPETVRFKSVSETTGWEHKWDNQQDISEIFKKITLVDIMDSIKSQPIPAGWKGLLRWVKATVENESQMIRMSEGKIKTIKKFIGDTAILKKLINMQDKLLEF